MPKCVVMVFLTNFFETLTCLLNTEKKKLF